MKFNCALFVVEDINKAKKFYSEVLGMKIIQDNGENVVFQGPFALHEKEHFRKLIDNLEVNSFSNNSELYFEEDDLDELEQMLKKEEIQFIHPIREQPWKQKVIRFYDPFGNIIEIGETLEHTAYRLHQEGMTDSEIAKTLNQDIDYVRKTISTYID
ncbi:MAG TPA: VOC family protein [Thermotogota bacterium]|nr:VOC family protein [Thermotogota bacterium]HPJ89346.1 VOC family protein [Thermotogota bacterium]HPR96530.1 VOC family protein [Thermotogota bacterium]